MSESDACEVRRPCDQVAIERARCRALLARTQNGTGFRMLAKRQELRRERCTCEMTEVPVGTALISLSALRDRGWTGSMLRALIYKRSGDALQACRRGDTQVWMHAVREAAAAGEMWRYGVLEVCCRRVDVEV